MKIAGFDIGGANTDLALVHFDETGNISIVKTDFLYFPEMIMFLIKGYFSI